MLIVNKIKFKFKMYILMIVVIVTLKVPVTSAVQIDFIDCGVDHEINVAEGSVEITQYPWLGILYYTFQIRDIRCYIILPNMFRSNTEHLQDGDVGEGRAVTTVALIQREFVIASAEDIGPMPKHDFRRNTRVLLGEDWRGLGRRVRNYVLHPQYEQTYNTVALVQLKDPVRTLTIKPLCPPPQILRNPEFYIVKFNEEFNKLEKQVIPVSHVPASLCREFYVRANLYAKRLRPPHATCAVSVQEDVPCVWGAGAALVARDVWGRWQLLGVGIRGPGCGAPSRYLDMMSYFPWIQDSLSQFRQITISKITKQNYVVRAGSNAYQRYGACDPEEKINLVYREMIALRTDNNQYQFLTYNMSLYENVEFSCLTLELVNASAVSEMRIKHFCPRDVYGPPCYFYKGSVFEISVYLMFSDKCRFEMFAWGWKKNLTLTDIHQWHWEEGTYYEDFTMTPVEYKGPTHESEFGYEPLDKKMWVPEFDVWTTTEFDNSSWSSTTKKPSKELEENQGGAQSGYVYKATTTTQRAVVITSPTTKRTKKTTKRRSRTTRRTTTVADKTTTGSSKA